MHVATQFMSEAPCTQDQFNGYFLTTAYDVLGDGGFSKHLKAKSTRGEEWALLLSEQYGAIAAVLDELTESVKATLGKGGAPLADIVNETMDSLSPPNTCVDTKYSRFIQMLWVCARLKHIIWCFTTTWFAEFVKGKQSKGKQVKCPTYAEIAEEMAEATKGDAARLYRLFVKAHACVRDAVNEAK